MSKNIVKQNNQRSEIIDQWNSQPNGNVSNYQETDGSSLKGTGVYYAAN